MTARVLVAGVGNIFLGDDGFGVEVVRAMHGTELPQGVEVTDFGIRGIHLAYQLLDAYDGLVVVDAVRRGDPPGTLSVIEVDPAAVARSSPASPGVDAHGLDPESVLRTLAHLGGTVGSVRVVGCEAEQLREEIGLSPAVTQAVPAAVGLVVEVATYLSLHAAEACGSKERRAG
jgi:hydrogenase maturation protease